jgi:hypothetical protein
MKKRLETKKDEAENEELEIGKGEEQRREGEMGRESLGQGEIFCSHL